MDEELVEEINCHTILHWNYRNYTAVPSELKMFGSHIEEIYLKLNRLTKIPNWIGDFKNLTNLYLSGNSLKELANEIVTLENLTVLDVSDNELSKLPDKINVLCNLTDLRVDNNKLRKLPENIGFLPALSFLSLANNRLERLPTSLGCCYSLQSISVNNNKLKTLSGNLAFLPELDFIEVSNNALLYLPSISFSCTPVIVFSNNPSINYLSYEVFLDISDSHPMNRNSNIFSATHNTNFHNVVQMPDVVEISNVVVHIAQWKKYKANLETLLVIPEPLNEIYGEETAKIPSLYELLLRALHSSHPSEKVTEFFYKHIDETIVPIHIKNVLIKGPAAKCHYCRCFVFTECVLWVVVQILMCNICRETEILTTVYFCSTFCARKFLNDEKDFDENEKISVHKVRWTRVN